MAATLARIATQGAGAVRARPLLVLSTCFALVHFVTALFVFDAGNRTWLLALAGFTVGYALLAVLAWWSLSRLGNRRHLAAAALLSWRERTLLLLALLILSTASVVYAGLNALLGSLHLPGTSAYDLGVVVNYFEPLVQAQRIEAAVRGWGDFMQNFPELPFAEEQPVRLVFVITYLDSVVIVPGYTIVMALLFRLTERTNAHDQLGLAVRKTSPLFWGALGGAVLADWLENWLTLLAVSGAHRGIPALARAASLLTWVCTWVKTLGLLTAALMLLVWWIFILTAAHWHTPEEPPAWDRGAALLALLRRIRVPIGLLAILYLLLKFPQANEIMRRWQTYHWEALAALAAAVLFACACGFYGWLANAEDLLVPLTEPESEPSWPSLLRSVAGVAAGLALGTAALILIYRWQQSRLCASGPCGSTAAIGWTEFVRVPLPAIVVLAILPLINKWINGLGVSSTMRERANNTRGKLAAPFPQPEEQAPLIPALGGLVVPFLLAVAALVVVGHTAATTATEAVAYTIHLKGGAFEARSWWLLWPTVALLGAAAVAVVAIRDAEPDRGRAEERHRALDPAEQQRQAAEQKGWALGLSAAAALVAFVVVAVFFLQLDLALLLGFVRGLGTIAVALLALTLLLAILSGAILVANDRAPQPAGLLHALRVYRPPVLTLMVVWVVISSNVASDAHRIRLQRAGPDPGTAGEARRGLTVTDAFDAWVASRCLTQTGAVTGPRPVVPLIFVAAEGGGMRAAAWADYVLDRTFDTRQEFASFCPDGEPLRQSDFLFALSGISGGSVGIATYVDYLLDPAHPACAQLTVECEQQRIAATGRRVEGALGADHLAAVVAWMFGLEFPRIFLPVPLHADRAAVLERSVERGWASQGLGTPAFFAAGQGIWDDRRRPAVPLMLLNATSVESGCRFVASPLETNGRPPNEPVTRCIAPLDGGGAPGQLPATRGALGATIDLVDLLCQNQDLPLSTAALISGRWPYVSPSANIEGCIPDPTTGYRPQTYLADGGYLEGSGNATILSLYEPLLASIRAYNQSSTSRAVLMPVLVTIKNGYAEPAGPDLIQTPPQLIVPPATLGQVMNARSALASQEAELRFTAPGDIPGLTAEQNGRRYTRFALQAHPGPSAELGWTLSPVAFEDFVNQYNRLPGSPKARVDEWFSGMPRR